MILHSGGDNAWSYLYTDTFFLFFSTNEYCKSSNSFTGTKANSFEWKGPLTARTFPRNSRSSLSSWQSKIVLISNKDLFFCTTYVRNVERPTKVNNFHATSEYPPRVSEARMFRFVKAFFFHDLVHSGPKVELLFLVHSTGADLIFVKRQPWEFNSFPKYKARHTEWKFSKISTFLWQPNQF